MRAVLLLLLLAACGRLATPAPPRAPAEEVIAPQVSRVALELEAGLPELRAALEAAVPKTIHAVDEVRERCLPPGLSCRLEGEVVRGPIALSGRGETLSLTIPLAGNVRASEILGFAGTPRATGRAVVRASVRFSLGPDWQPVPKVDLAWTWSEPPGVRLGPRRITFQHQVDAELAKLARQIEARLPAEIAKLRPRAELADAWASAHTSILLNRTNPEVWMRVTPRALAVGALRVRGDRVALPLVVEATTETFVGHRPPDPPVGPLPPPARLAADGFRLVIPVLADWEVLEGVLGKALTKAAAKGITVPVLGAVDARFGRPTLYGTGGGRVALGLPLEARSGLVRAKGKVWLTAAVRNAPGSQRLGIADLEVTGDLEGAQGRLLLAVVNAPVIREAIAAELGQNFTRDFEGLMAKIDRALTDRRIGAFLLNARIAETHNGVIRPLGQGAFLLVEARGDADLLWKPEAAPPRRAAQPAGAASIRSATRRELSTSKVAPTAS